MKSGEPNVDESEDESAEKRLGERARPRCHARKVAGLLVAALGLGAPHSDALAEPSAPHISPSPSIPPPDPIADPPQSVKVARPPRDPSTVEMARIGAGVLYVRGSKRLGIGTRAGYQVLVGFIDLDVVRFPHERLGFEIHLTGGPIGFNENAQADVGLSSAGLVAPFRWKGRAPGSFVLGIGGSFELGRPVWLEPGFHGTPIFLARFRIFPSRSVSIQTTYRYVPITTDELWLQEHDVDCGVSTGLLQIGLRMRVDEARGGEPYRLYRSIGGGLFAGIVVF